MRALGTVSATILLAFIAAVSTGEQASAGVTAAGCPASPNFSFLHTDPAGDLTPSGQNNRDVLSVAATGDSETVCVTVTFAVPVDPALTELYFDASIGFDVDEDTATGLPFGAFYFNPPYPPILQCGNPGATGVERVFDLASGELHELLREPAYPWLTQPVSSTPVAVTYDGNSFTAVIPVSILGGDTGFHFEVMVRDHPFADDSYAHDCAPNGASLRSPDGAIIPQRDLDGDSVLDWLDNCPGLPNAAQLDFDFDFVGDDCDPSPTHAFDVTRLTASNATAVSRAGGMATLRGVVTVANLNPWTDTPFVEVSVEGLPAGCSASNFRLGWSREFTVGALGTTRVRWNTDVACDPGTAARGTYSLGVVSYVGYNIGFGETPLGLDMAATEAVLRIR